MMEKLLGWLPSRRRLEAERANARRQAEDAEQHETESEDTIREAYMVAHKLATHRNDDHFAQRMRAAYRGREGSA